MSEPATRSFRARLARLLIPSALLVIGGALLGMGAERRASPPPALSTALAFRLVDEMSGLAGTAYLANEVLDAVDSDPRTPGADRARSALLRCQVRRWSAGPRAAAADCSRAVALAEGRGVKAEVSAAVSYALNLSALGDHAGALRALSRMAPEDPLLRAKVRWARVRALRELTNGAEVAVAEAVSALDDVEAEVRTNPAAAEFRAVAGLRLGEALIASGRPEEASRRLRAALDIQRKLCAENPDYPEYALYLARILRALGGTPGGEEEGLEAGRLISRLRSFDPGRWEYGAGF